MMSQTIELTVNQKIGKKSGISLTAYRTQIENIIHSVSDNGNTNLYNNKFLGWDVAYIEVPFNDGTQTNVGGNLLINSTFQAGKIKLNTYSSVSYVDAKLAGPDGEEVEQSSITPWQFRLGTDGKWRAFQFSARYMQTGKQRMGGFTDNDNPYERKTINGYSLLNLSAGYNLKNNTTFFINVQNALNNKYRTSLAWDSSNPNGETFNGALQNPLRIMIGVRVGF
jgi:outer membrane cobalamin receptor